MFYVTEQKINFFQNSNVFLCHLDSTIFFPFCLTSSFLPVIDDSPVILTEPLTFTPGVLRCETDILYFDRMVLSQINDS